MKNRLFAASGILALAAFASAVTLGAETKPKYGPAASPKATPIGLSPGYFQLQKHPAPDYWALTGYYVPQFNGYACSVGAVTMAVNAARVRMAKTADDKVVTQPDIIEKVKAEHWKERVTEVGYQGVHGVELDALGKITEAAFREYGFPKAKAKVVHVNDTSAATKKALVDALVRNEKSDRDFILANFNQQAFTDDADVGHIAPIGAYDAALGRVLIMDPDRDYYEPYWVSVDAFLAGMATKDKSVNAFRGYVIVDKGE